MKLNCGDRIAYSAAFLKSVSGDRAMAERRATYLGPYPLLPKTHAYVRWDDQEARIATGAGDYACPDYCAEVRANGSVVALKAIAKVGSARFADTYAG